MPLIAPNPLREKILIWGLAGVGKSTCWASIMWWAAQTGDDRHFWIIDTDDAIPEILIESKYDICKNYSIKQVYDWEGFMEASAWAVSNAKEGDFIIVDMVTAIWDWVQKWDIETILDKRYAEYIDDKSRELAAERGPSKKWRMLLHEEKNWDRINPVYHQYFSEDILLKSPAHVIAVAEATAKWKNNAPVEGAFRPKGQNRLPFAVRSDLYVDKKVWGRSITTHKDRGRPYLEDEQYEDFFQSYLCKIARWDAS